MPKSRDLIEAEKFGNRLVKLLANAGHPRHGAGAYLAGRYDVSTVVANAWLNGAYKPAVETARRIAADHGSTFEELYLGEKRAWPFEFDRERYERLTTGQKIRAEGALLGAIVDMEEEGTNQSPKKSTGRAAGAAAKSVRAAAI